MSAGMKWLMTTVVTTRLRAIASLISIFCLFEFGFLWWIVALAVTRMTVIVIEMKTEVTT